MNDPIAIDENNVIIEGHGRFYALKDLCYNETECIILNHLSEEQKKAYVLIHNKLTMNTDFDISVLNDELNDIFNIDMEDFGFDLDFSVDTEIKEDDEKENERERTNRAYNLELFDVKKTAGKYQIPTLEKEKVIPKELIGFNYVKSTEAKRQTGVHFYLDDYQFERIWNSPELYTDLFMEYSCILTPDFSLYSDMSMAMKIWNVYRSRLIGQYYQQQGIRVIPTISWAEKETFEFCFDGIQEGSVVSVSTIGVKRNKNSYEMWKNGMDEMIKRIKPIAILVYGGEIEYNYGKIKVIYFKNNVTEIMNSL
jgi:hypothetical protein